MENFVFWIILAAVVVVAAGVIVGVAVTGRRRRELRRGEPTGQLPGAGTDSTGAPGDDAEGDGSPVAVLDGEPAEPTIPALEALIITVTAVVLGLLATACGVAFQLWALQVLLPQTALGWSPGILAGVAVACLLVTVAATVLPTVPALRRPVPAVVARLVTE